MSDESRGDEGADQVDGTTPIDPEEAEALIPTYLTTRAELNQWEALNIARAQEWAADRKRLDPLSVAVLCDLHQRMFDETWSWAGEFRHSEKSISPHHWSQIPVLLRELVANMRKQYETSDRTPEQIDEIAVRFHHQLVRIHPWPNGNGRHARLATDLLLRHWGRSPFTWGGTDRGADRETRRRYIAALRAADGWEYGPLREFVRS